MAWAATATPGTIPKIKVASTFKQIEACQSMSGPSGSKPIVEVQGLSDLAKKFKGGRPDYGKVNFEMAFDPTDPSHLEFLTAFAAVPSVNSEFEIALTDVGTAALNFFGKVDEIGLSIPNEGPVILKAGVKITSGITDTAATSITPNAAFVPIVGQGCTLGFWTGAAYVTLPGATNVEISGASRAVIPATAMSALVPNFLMGIPSNGKISFDLLYDSSDANHILVLAAFNAASQTDRFLITMTDASNATITLNPCMVDTWEYNVGQKDSANLVKVSATINCPIVVVP